MLDEQVAEVARRLGVPADRAATSIKQFGDTDAWLVRDGARVLVLKRGRSEQDDADVTWEHAVLSGLAASRFPSSVPVRAFDDRSWTRLGGRIWAALSFLPGQALASEAAPDSEAAGAFLARYHRAARTLAVEEQRPTAAPIERLRALMRRDHLQGALGGADALGQFEMLLDDLEADRPAVPGPDVTPDDLGQRQPQRSAGRSQSCAAVAGTLGVGRSSILRAHETPSDRIVAPRVRMSVELPPELAGAIDRLLQEIGPRELNRASAELSISYREKRQHRAPVARTRPEILAYAATRLPATFAAITAALWAVKEQRPGWAPRSVLDLGAGPGTGLWSAATVWPSIERATAVEAESRMIELGQALARTATQPAVRATTWVQGDVTRAATPGGPYDLVLAGYVLGELDPGQLGQLVEDAAEVTSPTGTTVLVEPGTPDGYGRVLVARERLMAGGGFVTAPCPHDRPCPMVGPEQGGRDWCHFAVRLPRTTAHRTAKQGSLGYEDEKYAYVAVSREPTVRTGARVLRHPQIRPRQIVLELCTATGLRTTTVPKSNRDVFRQARKIDWGGRFDYTGDDATSSATAP